jgi:N-acetylneuraminic acid mutarotase
MRKTAALLLVLLVLASALLIGAEMAFGAASVEGSWTTVAPLPKPYYENVGAAVVNGKIYFLGGDICERYDPETNSWTAVTPPPVYNAWGAVVACQNKIYVIGGAAEYPTQVYDPATGTWENRTSPPGTTLSHQATAVDDKIYLIGGAQLAPLGILATSAVNYVYDTTTDSWSTMAPIPTPVSSYASAVLDGKIYIIGGRTATVKVKNATDLVQIFDPKTNRWTEGTPIPTGVSSAGACSTSGVYAPKRIYVVGGLRGYSGGGTSYDATKTGTDVNQVYDPKTGSWSLAASLPDVCWGLSLVNVNDILFSVGGTNGTHGPIYVSGDLSDWDAAKQLMSRTKVQATCKYIPAGYDESLLPSPSPSTSPSPSPSPEPQPETFLTLLVVAASIAVIIVAAGLLVYHKKRSHEVDGGGGGI